MNAKIGQEIGDKLTISAASKSLLVSIMISDGLSEDEFEIITAALYRLEWREYMLISE